MCHKETSEIWTIKVDVLDFKGAYIKALLN